MARDAGLAGEAGVTGGAGFGREAGVNPEAGAKGTPHERAGRLQRLHVIAGDGIVGAEDWRQRLRPVIEAGGDALALHLRARRTSVVRLFEAAEWLVEASRRAGALVVVNDRVDVALAAGAGGVHLREDSLPAGAVRAIAGPELRVGRSIHAPRQAAELGRERLDYLFAGAAYATPTHPGRAPAGPEAVAEAAAQAVVPVIAIGGVTPERTRELSALGVHGVAVMSGVWGRRHPGRAVTRYLQVLQGGGSPP